MQTKNFLNNYKKLIQFRPNIYKDRRDKLINLLQDSIIIIPTSSEKIRSNDTAFEFRPDSNFYYLTGFKESESILVIDTILKTSTLFCKIKDKSREIWDGYIYGQDDAKKIFNFDNCFPITEFKKYLNSILLNHHNLYFPISDNTEFSSEIFNALKVLKSSKRRGTVLPENILDINNVLSKMRLKKDPYEIELIKYACDISSNAHIFAMGKTKPNMYEFEIEAELKYRFSLFGAKFQAYTSIVASASNACTLHYIENNKLLKDGDLLLVDAGCEFEFYSSDITRTWPINGKFSPEQKAIYEIVLEANKKAIDSIKLNHPFNTAQNVAIKILTQGLIDLKILNGSLEENIEQGTYRNYYMHGIGHYIGIDVHDVGDYIKKNGDYVHYEENMVLTIEPGLYLDSSPKIPKYFQNIGIRIEDDLWISNNGIKNLTQALPKEIAQIEELVGIL